MIHLQRLLNEATRTHRATHLQLHRLSEANVAALMDAFPVSYKMQSMDLSRQLYAETDGEVEADF